MFRFHDPTSRTLSYPLAIALGAIALISCNKSSSSGTISSYPTGMAVASPTATSTTAASQASGLQLGEGTLGSFGYEAEIDPETDFAAKKEILDSILEAANDDACKITLPPFMNQPNPTCYGPNLDYEDHPDGTPADGQMPGGDLGIWTASDAGVACTAAKINSLIVGSANYADYVMMLSAALRCRFERSGTTIPVLEGVTTDLTSELHSAVVANNPNVTVTSATLAKLTDVTDTDSVDRPAFLYTLVAEDTSGMNTVTVTAYVKHLATATGFKGRIWVEREGAPNAGDVAAVSIAYQKTFTRLRIDMMSADYQGVGSPDVFNSDGTLKVDGNWSGNIARAMLDLDPDTGLGNFSYAWQAGTGDSHARIFNGYTTETGGCGFFGFGERFDNAAGTASDNAIDGMICNWAGPGNNHSMSATANLAQKQCMTIDSSTGIFEASTSNIAFAPTNSCNGDGVMTVRVGSDPFALAVTSHSLVDLTADDDFAAYTAPTAPNLPGGF